MIHNDYTVAANFQLIDPVLQQNNRELGMQEVRLGVKSKETYREDDLRLPNETKEMDRLGRQIVREHPAVTEALAKDYAEELGVAEIMREYETNPEGIEGGGGGGAPSGPPGAPPQNISAMAGGGATASPRQVLDGNTERPPEVTPVGM